MFDRFDQAYGDLNEKEEKIRDYFRMLVHDFGENFMLDVNHFSVLVPTPLVIDKAPPSSLQDFAHELVNRLHSGDDVAQPTAVEFILSLNLVADYPALPNELSKFLVRNGLPVFAIALQNHLHHTLRAPEAKNIKAIVDRYNAQYGADEFDESVQDIMLSITELGKTLVDFGLVMRLEPSDDGVLDLFNLFVDEIIK